MIPAVIYARYSSSNQREESIAGQIRDCKAYAERNNFQVIAEYTDSALTGRTDRRPGFQEMIKDSEKHEFQAVIVWKLDRFARNRYDSAMYRNKLKKNGVKIYSAMENITDSPEGIILEGLMESLAEYYSANLSENVKRGMYDSALDRKILGSPCYGYRRGIDGRYEIDPETAPIVQEIFSSYQSGQTITEIILDLNEKGYKTAQKKPFNKNSLRAILNNEKYTGMYRYRDIVDPNGIPVIIQPREFAEVQEILKGRYRHRKRRSQEEPYLLSSLLFCGECGAAMTGESVRSSNGNTYRYYSCVKQKKHECKKKRVSKDLIEREVMRIVNDEILTDEKIDDLARKAVQAQKADARHESKFKLEQDLKQTEKKISNLSHTIETYETVPRSLIDRLAELEKERDAISARISHETAMVIEHSYDEIVEYLRALKSLSETKSKPQRILIDACILRIYCFDIDDGFRISVELKTGSEKEPKTLEQIVRLTGGSPCLFSETRTITDSVVIFVKIKKDALY